MSDRYLFKAKRTDNGEWIEGYPIIDECGYFIMPEDYISERQLKNKNYGYELILIKAFDVDPETLCQYTGLTDKNGKIIFRGDVVKRWIYKKYIIGEVVWLDVGFCGFYLKCGNNLYPIGKGEDTGLSDCDEIIGNIFDNPELLEGGVD